MTPQALAQHWLGFAAFEEHQADTRDDPQARLYDLGQAHAHRAAAFQMLQELCGFDYQQAMDFVNQSTVKLASVTP